jgi:ureidoglycolate lyase
MQTETLTLVPQPLTKEAFAPYGEVIESKLDSGKNFTINEGKILRFHDLAQVETDSNGTAIISMAETVIPMSIPMQFNIIERHPLGSQAFIPLFSEPMIVVVGEFGDKPDLGKLRAFISNGKQGINYKMGLWHMPLIGSADGQQWIVVDRGGPGINCDEYKFEPALNIKIDV